jgi:acyl-CoA synthetase (AMP-forming)/AMP-acid ligase II
MNALFLSKLTVFMNASAVLMPRFDAQAYIRAIDRFGVSWLTSVPTMLALAVRERAVLEQTDRGSVERISMGSAPLTEALCDEVQRWFPQAQISNFYGTTEHGPSAFGPHSEGLPRPKRSIGCLASGVEVRLVGGANEDEGILEVRSLANMTGYKGLGDKTEAVLKDNWYHTGDVMRRDGNGFYFIVGREDDMFVCNGENVYPDEVERLLEAHSAIDQASVVPVDDPIRGHAPVAFVVKAKGASIDEQELQEHARAHGPAYRYPRRVFFIDALPLAGTNKIDRGKLMKQAAELYKDVRRTAEDQGA